MFEKLLLAIDDSPATAVASDFALALARRCGASVHVLFVNERLVAGRGLTLLSSEEATRLVGDAVLRLRDAGVRTGGSIHVADHQRVAECIVEVAHRKSADAIVLGSRRRRRTLNRLFASRIRDRVTRRTSLPVIVAPSPLDIASQVGLDVEELDGRRPGTEWVPSR
jgi:nucleotide-binding universal stress UspA family protein